MRGGASRYPRGNRIPATSGTKGNHSPAINRSRHGIKRRRGLSKTETLSLTHESVQNQTRSTRFVIDHCSTQKHKQRRKRKSEYGDYYRQWVFSSRDFSDHTDKFVVVSYNILGVENASKHPDLYFDVLPKFLNWDRRKRLISKEISHYNPSILCFQEVDRFNDLDDLLQTDGFKGVHKARTGEAYDGCAIFWKDDRFSLLHEESIEFRTFGLRDNVAQLCVLKMKESYSNSDADTPASLTSPPRRVLIGNIHVLFNPNRGDIKLGQVRLFLEKAHKLSQEWGNIPVVISGDLNSMPQSALYQFLASSQLDIRFHDRRKISGQIGCPLQSRPFRPSVENAVRFPESILRPSMFRWSEEELRLATGNEEITFLRHHLNLCSAYHGIPGSNGTRDNNGEPLATSYHSKFMGTVDYIWHTDQLVPVKVLDTPSVDALRKTRGLPSERWGSDHLALVCELAFADSATLT